MNNLYTTMIENLDWEWRDFLQQFYEKTNLSKDLKWEFERFLLRKLSEFEENEQKMFELEDENKYLNNEIERLEEEVDWWKGDKW